MPKQKALTAQEIFDTVAAHLRKQGRPATNGGDCAYRGDDGTMCAVGCLIRDEEYSVVMEGNNVWTLLAQDWLPKRLAKHVRLLSDLQEAHDGAPCTPAFLGHIELSLEAVARLHGLTYRPV